MVSKQKILFVNNLKETLKDKIIIAIADVSSIPASSLQQIRKILKSEGYYIKFVRKRLLIKSLEQLKDQDPKLEELINSIKSNKKYATLLLLPSKEINPFDLYKFLQQNKSYRAARVGDVLDSDVIIRAGPTNFTPGPILTDLKKFGIKTKVEGGKVVIAEDAVVAKKGDVVNQDLLSLLQKFDIKPIPVVLKLILVYNKKNGIIYTEDILSIPLETYVEQIKSGFRKSIALTLEIGYPTKDNIKLLLTRTYQYSKNLALKTDLISKDTIKDLLIKSLRISNALKSKTNI